MTIYMSLLNLLANPTSVFERLTTVGSRSERNAVASLRHLSNQAPPRSPSLWERRLRIQSIRARELSPHMRRDIGLDF